MSDPADELELTPEEAAEDVLKFLDGLGIVVPAEHKEAVFNHIYRRILAWEDVCLGSSE